MPDHDTATPDHEANAYADGRVDAANGLTAEPWPWDDDGKLEAAYWAGYDATAVFP